ncbi:hypothetical protein [Roseibium aggregatum]|uniref:SPOR domain-containing protein n=1 Tax=Roseibium aggregatum TaxID=187304 RepID=A0A939J1S9_9HYPH|nr:hypothetical protein [Roseibium aggregatum]MBN9670678.1 hypothetical protein [Roseibium aggregatum]
MATVGFASYQFGSGAAGSGSGTVLFQKLPLPPSGDVESTASIGYAGNGYPLEIMQVQRSAPTYSETSDNKGQIEVLQREVVGLRRRLSALSEQNLTYSRRIAALEKEVALAKLTGSVKTPANGNKLPATPAEPSPGIVITKPAPEPLPRPKQALTPAASNANDATAQPVAGSMPAPMRVIDVNRTAPRTASKPKRIANPSEPVRIVDLPAAGVPPAVTGSIPTQKEAGLPEQFDATPTRTALKPKIIAPSEPSGRLKGGGESKLKRSDFGAVIGRYATEAEAVKAWASFKEQNIERMRDLQPLLMTRQVEEGGVSLLVGPFANAADAAVACLHLLDVTALCHPTLFAGEPLISAANMRETGF